MYSSVSLNLFTETASPPHSPALSVVESRSSWLSGLAAVAAPWSPVSLEGITKSEGGPVRGTALAKALWKPDHEAVACSEEHCSVRFGLIDRKHHCRRCGQIFCGAHSSNTTLLWPAFEDAATLPTPKATPKSTPHSSSTNLPGLVATSTPTTSPSNSGITLTLPGRPGTPPTSLPPVPTPVPSRVCDTCFFSTPIAAQQALTPPSPNAGTVGYNTKPLAFRQATTPLTRSPLVSPAHSPPTLSDLHRSSSSRRSSLSRERRAKSSSRSRQNSGPTSSSVGSNASSFPSIPSSASSSADGSQVFFGGNAGSRRNISPAGSLRVRNASTAVVFRDETLSEQTEEEESEDEEEAEVLDEVVGGKGKAHHIDITRWGSCQRDAVLCAGTRAEGSTRRFTKGAPTLLLSFLFLQQSDERMPFPTVKLSSGYEIPGFAFGCGSKWRTSSVNDGSVDEGLVKAIHEALDAGFTSIDGAENYFNEDSLGHALATYPNLPPRSDLFIKTKVLSSIAAIPSSLKLQLERLKLSYIDLYLIHSPKPFDVDTEEGKEKLRAAWREMEQLVDEGWVRSIGVSNFEPRHFEAFWDEARIKPALNQDTLEYCKEKGIVGGPLDAVLLEISASLAAKGQQVTLGQILYQWASAKGYTIVSTSAKFERMKEYLGGGDFGLTPEQIQKIDEAGAEGEKKGYGQYNAWLVSKDQVPKDK
ncbi:putative ketoreductase [Pseudohyphozyma bogoriensis]|nr:putative ketoreductase [Pseudohyphozyma bogoriensis]